MRRAYMPPPGYDGSRFVSKDGTVRAVEDSDYTPAENNAPVGGSYSSRRNSGASPRDKKGAPSYSRRAYPDTGGQRSRNTESAYRTGSQAKSGFYSEPERNQTENDEYLKTHTADTDADNAVNDADMRMSAGREIRSGENTGGTEHGERCRADITGEEECVIEDGDASAEEMLSRRSVNRCRRRTDRESCLPRRCREKGDGDCAEETDCEEECFYGEENSEENRRYAGQYAEECGGEYTACGAEYASECTEGAGSERGVENTQERGTESTPDRGTGRGKGCGTAEAHAAPDRAHRLTELLRGENGDLLLVLLIILLSCEKNTENLVLILTVLLGIR